MNYQSTKHKQITWPLVFGLMFALATVLAFSFLLKDDEEKEHLYPDLSSRSVYSCAEVNNFVNEFDPFYKWALRSSLSSLLQMNINGNSANNLQLANTAYQQASAWRVVSNWTRKDGTSKVYASSEPHVKGGHMKQKRFNWVWRMRTDWGISMRMCLSNGISGMNMSCVWTTPVVATSAGVFGLLHIGIPYRASMGPGISPEAHISNVKHTEGFYLTNYASSARANFTEHQQLDPASSYYLTRDFPECKSSPFYYSPDAVSYLAFPALQCACSSSGKVCLVVTTNMNNASWGLFTNNSPCASLKSYWAWNTGSDSSLVYAAYNSSGNKLFPIRTPIPNQNYSVSSIDVASLKVMENVTDCVENLMIQHPVPSKEQVIDKCSAAAGVKITAATDPELQLMLRKVWVPHPEPEAGSESCLKDLPKGQLDYRDNTCVKKLDDSTNSALQNKIMALANLSDVHFKVNEAWKQGQENRHAVYGGVFTAALALMAGIFAAQRSTFQDAEHGVAAWVDKRTGCLPWLKMVESYWIRFLSRTIFLVFAPAGTLLYTAYSGIKSVNKDRALLQAQTVSQTLSDGNVILVTTTATSLVDPIWTSLIALCCITSLVVIRVLIRVGFVLEPNPKQSERGAEVDQ